MRGDNMKDYADYKGGLHILRQNSSFYSV